MIETIFDHDRLAMKINIIAESHAKYNAIPDYEHEHHCVEHEGTTEKVTTFNQDLTTRPTPYSLLLTSYYLRLTDLEGNK